MTDETEEATPMPVYAYWMLSAIFIFASGLGSGSCSYDSGIEAGAANMRRQLVKVGYADYNEETGEWQLRNCTCKSQNQHTTTSHHEFPPGATAGELPPGTEPPRGGQTPER